MSDKTTMDWASGLRKFFIDIRSNKLFELFVIAIIVISALKVGIGTYPLGPNLTAALKGLDYAVTIFFLVEILIRIAAEPNLKRFFSKGWNIFDFVIVTASLIPIDESEMALLGRLLRIFRVLRLVSMIPELQVLLNALLQAIPRMGYVSSLDVHHLLHLWRGREHLLQRDQSGALGQYLHRHADPVPRGHVRGLDRRDVRDHGGLPVELDFLSQLHLFGCLHFLEHDDRHRNPDAAERTREDRSEQHTAPEMIASENPITAPSIDVRLKRIEAQLENLSDTLSNAPRRSTT